MSEAVRQRYNLATGGGQTPQPSSAGSPGFAKGGPVKAKGIAGFKKGAQNRSGMVSGHSMMVAGKSC